jgi:excisionase family DNA binding protein
MPENTLGNAGQDAGGAAAGQEAVKLTTAEACQRAGMNRERLLRRVQAGEITGEQVAGRWLIDAESLDEYVRQNSAA